MTDDLRHPVLTGFDPAAEPLNVEVSRTEAVDGVRYEYLHYDSHDIDGVTLRAAAIRALPEHAEAHTCPAVLHLHGGAQGASEETIGMLARNGYVGLIVDWSGPASGLSDWVTEWPEDMLLIQPAEVPVEKAAVGHVVQMVRRGLTLLEQTPGVDPERLGLVGISWGGLMSWLVNGTDERLKAVIPIYGCGLHDSRSVPQHWREAFQPALYAAHQTAPILHLNGTNDFFGRLDTAENILRDLSVDHRRLYVPNEDHGLSDAARRAALKWFDIHLKNDGTLPAEPVLAADATTGTISMQAPGAERCVLAAAYGARDESRQWVWRTQDVPSGRDGTFSMTHFPERDNLRALLATAFYPDGSALSSPVEWLVDDAERCAPVEDPVVFDARRDGTDGWFLRWQYSNLDLTRCAPVSLATGEVDGEPALVLQPDVNGAQCFFRMIRHSAGFQCLELTIATDNPCEAVLNLYETPGILKEEKTSFSFRLTGGGLQRVELGPLPGNASPGDVEILHLEVPESAGRVCVGSVILK